MFNQNDIYVMNQSKALTAIGESLKSIGSQLQSLAPPGNTLDPPDSQNTAAVDKPEEDAVSCDQILENCTDSLHAPLSTEGEETMAKVKVRLRVCVGYNRDHSPIIKQISADSETELADRVAIALMQSERRNEFIKYADDPIRSSVPLFRDYAEEWFTVYKASRIKATTAGGYRTILQSHLYPAWGGTPLNEITTKAIQEFLNGRSDRSRKTLQEILMLLKAILESARKDRLIEFNPADDRRLRIPSEKKTERTALSMEDERDILANISKLQRQDQRFLALLIYTGMRRGEVLGLMWEDIDLEANVIHVRRNVTYPGGRNDPLIGTTKTKSGVRDIPIIPDLLRYLKPFGKGKFVVGEGQTPITMSVTRRRMERINRVINMHGATAHVFRHSFATMLNDAGASVKTIQSIIGQSDFKTTADRYCHARDSSKQEAVRDLTALLTSN